MLPRRLYVQCPVCDTALEAALCEFAIGMATDEEEGPGIGVQLSAFIVHECED